MGSNLKFLSYCTVSFKGGLNSTKLCGRGKGTREERVRYRGREREIEKELERERERVWPRGRTAWVGGVHAMSPLRQWRERANRCDRLGSPRRTASWL